MTSIASCVTRECSAADHPALRSKHADMYHRFVVLHLDSGYAKTVEYGHFDPHTTDVGTIRIHDGAQTIHAFVDAREFDTSSENALAFETFQHWVLSSACGYQNTEVTPSHDCQTFVDDVSEWLINHTKRPPQTSHQSDEHALTVKEPDAAALAIFDAVKNRNESDVGDDVQVAEFEIQRGREANNDKWACTCCQEKVVNKIQELHQKDVVHHTHLVDQATHSSSYKLIQYALVEVDYGHIYFGKIYLGGVQYVHARVHKYHQADAELVFHSIYLTRDSAIMSRTAPLTWFEE